MSHSPFDDGPVTGSGDLGTIEFVCQTCGRQLRVPLQFAGRKAKCPECGAVQPIAGPPASAPRPQTTASPPPAVAALPAIGDSPAASSGYSTAPPVRYDSPPIAARYEVAAGTPASPFRGTPMAPQPPAPPAAPNLTAVTPHHPGRETDTKKL
nr:zinc ribbon-containing protein [Pirellulaceae bacterium]